MTCPEDRCRRSLALYYYSNGRPASETSAAHSTLFRERPNEDLKEPVSRSKQVKTMVKKLVPPIVFDLFAKSP